MSKKEVSSEPRVNLLVQTRGSKSIFEKLLEKWSQASATSSTYFVPHQRETSQRYDFEPCLAAENLLLPCCRQSRAHDRVLKATQRRDRAATPVVAKLPTHYCSSLRLATSIHDQAIFHYYYDDYFYYYYSYSDVSSSF